MKKLWLWASLFLICARAWACASCGCSLNTDYGTQGMGNNGGWTFDLRYDFVNQSQLRSGTHGISMADATRATNTVTASPAEVEGYTRNRYLNASLDYNDGEKWGLTALIPYVSRQHMTYGSDGNGAYTSKENGLGDIKLIGRYFGWAEQRDWGLQLGVKLPSGRFNATDISGTNPVDPGLQLGSKTTDIILGAYKFGPFLNTENWGYFFNTQVQRAINSSNIPANLVQISAGQDSGTYRPGNSLNINFGFNYHGFEQWTPMIQFNYLNKKADGGTAGDAWATGGRLLYVTPGAMVNLTDQAKLLLNLQLPLYQNVNGIQLAPKYIVSAGLRFGF